MLACSLFKEHVEGFLEELSGLLRQKSQRNTSSFAGLPLSINWCLTSLLLLSRDVLGTVELDMRPESSGKVPYLWFRASVAQLAKDL
jgi:hypothetical protein